MSEGIERLAEINGQTLEECVQAATGLDLAAFSARMADKGQQRYVVATQNSDRCNQSCSHCFMTERDRSDEGKPLDEDEVGRLLRTFQGRGYRTYMYYQEPVMRPDYFEKLREFPQETAEINPLFFARVEGLVDKVLAHGIREIKHSLHGDPPAHTALTGSSPDLFAATLEGMRIIKAAGLRLGIESTFSRENAHCADYLARLLSEYGVDDWYLGRTLPVGAAREWPLERFLRGEAAARMVSDLVRAHAALEGHRPQLRFESNWGPNFLSRRHYRYLLGEIEGEPVKSTYWCDAIDTHMLYTSTETGRVYPCFYHLAFEDEAIGAWDAETADVRLEPAQVEKWSAASLSRELRGMCAAEACPFHALCLGGCRATAFAFARREGDPRPHTAGMDFCLTHELLRRSRRAPARRRLPVASLQEALG